MLSMSFAPEEIATKRIVAASMIIGKHGTPEAPHYYLEMDSDERYSHSLRKKFRHSYVRLRYSMRWPTEIGGLIVNHAMRGHPERVGKQISWVRFLYIAKHRARFESQVLAEMLAPMLDGHGNVFWDNFGRSVAASCPFARPTSYRRVTRSSSGRSFPRRRLTFLLPEKVRNSLGAVGENTRGAVRLLEQAGMRFLHHIDPFDGGPYYGAAIDELQPVKDFRTCIATAREPAVERARSYIVACEGRRGFRAVRAEAEIDGNQLAVTPA